MLAIATVTLLCAGYTLLTVTGVLGDDAERFSWGEGGLSGVCVGPSSWCRGIVRS